MAFHAESRYTLHGEKTVCQEDSISTNIVQTMQSSDPKVQLSTSATGVKDKQYKELAKPTGLSGEDISACFKTHHYMWNSRN